MNCNCKWFEVVIALIVIVFAKWGSMMVSATTSMYILVIAGVALLLHAFKCKNCGMCCAPKDMEMNMTMSEPGKKTVTKKTVKKSTKRKK